MMYQSQFTNYNTCTTLVGDIDNGRLCICGDKGIYGKSVPSPPFCYEPKMALKNKIWIKEMAMMLNFMLGIFYHKKPNPIHIK